MDNDGESQAVWTIDIPIEFFNQHCLTWNLSIQEFDENFVTVGFISEKSANTFKDDLINYDRHVRHMFFRQEMEPFLDWSNEYISYRYGLDFLRS